MLEGGDGIGGFEGGGGDRMPLDGPSAAIREQNRAARRREIEAELAAKVTAWKALRDRIGKEFKDFRLAFAPPDVSVSKLAGSLGADEALALLFMHKRKDGAATHHACLISADGAVTLERLDGLAAVTADRHVVDPRGALRGPLRGTVGGAAAAPSHAPHNDDQMDDAPAPPPPEEHLEQRLERALWAPLRAALPGVRRWRIATHQDLHVLPVHLGAGPDEEAIVLPGLLFQQRPPNAAQAPAAPRLALHVDAALETDEPIPFVEAEAALIRAIWGEDRAPVSSGAATLARLRATAPAFDALALAAHGYARGEPPQIVVDLDRKDAMRLDAADVLGAAQRPRAVLMSACVAGRVNEDADGEPLGLVSAFFLRGADFVIAPLKPIPDFYAPIFAGLFHLAWRETGDPDDALLIARRQTLSGDWPDGFEAMLRKAYEDVMDAILRNAEKDGTMLIRKLNGWPPKNPIHGYYLADFIDAHCRTPEARKALINKTLNHLFDETKAPNKNLRHIVQWTVKFG